MTTDTAPFRDHTDEWRLADGRRLGYGLYGASDGPLVVVLDGPGSRGLARAMASPATELGIKLLAPDRPGFGSSSPADERSIAAVSGDLLALVDHLGFRRFGLIAQSGGTPYALAVAAAGPGRVTGLAFIGGMAPLDEPHASMSRRLAKLLGGAPVTVVAGAWTFAMLPCYPEALRHAAALPENGTPRGGQASRVEFSACDEAVGSRADSTHA